MENEEKLYYKYALRIVSSKHMSVAEKRESLRELNEEFNMPEETYFDYIDQQ
jgi:hypothetical protein